MSWPSKPGRPSRSGRGLPAFCKMCGDGSGDVKSIAGSYLVETAERRLHRWHPAHFGQTVWFDNVAPATLNAVEQLGDVDLGP